MNYTSGVSHYLPLPKGQSLRKTYHHHQHRVIKKFECNFCGRTFSRRDNLRQHQETACKVLKKQSEQDQYKLLLKQRRLQQQPQHQQPEQLQPQQQQPRLQPQQQPQHQQPEQLQPQKQQPQQQQPPQQLQQQPQQQQPRQQRQENINDKKHENFGLSTNITTELSSEDTAFIKENIQESMRLENLSSRIHPRTQPSSDIITPWLQEKYNGESLSAMKPPVVSSIYTERLPFGHPDDVQGESQKHKNNDHDSIVGTTMAGDDSHEQNLMEGYTHFFESYYSTRI